MKRGAVVMMDALGFRGIWQRHDPAEVLANMKQLAEEVEKECEELRRSPPLGMVRLDEYRIDFASDSVMIAVSTTHDAMVQDISSVCLASMVASRFLRGAAAADIPLTYRGCISYGEFLLEKRFVIGPAIDCAAAYMEKAQGALVWVHPSAFVSPLWRKVASNSDELPDRPPLLNHSVPLKGGERCETLAVSPFRADASRADCETLSERIKATFGDQHEKRDNTATFLRAAVAFHT